MASVWRSALPLLFVAALIVFEEKVSVPSCDTTGGGLPEEDRPEDLKVMMVADLLLLGPDAGFADFYFRRTYAAKFFRKAFEKLKPDILIVLGDVSAKGFEFTESDWLIFLQQFQKMLGPFLGVPLHIILGDRDVGICMNMSERFVSHIASNLPGLDSSGCGAFEISNVSFVSLNAVALLCGNDLRFSVEKVIESESLDLRSRAKDVEESAGKGKFSSLIDFHWRENAASTGSGPVLLLHFPLHQRTISNCDSIVLKRNLWHRLPKTHKSFGQVINRRLAGAGPYELMHTLPPNATDYILQALKPRIVFSAHNHQFCDHIHVDGTREVTVPAMSWMARDDPGFIVVSFGQNKIVTVSHCSLARESHVIMAYFTIFIFLIAIMLVTSSSYLMNLFAS